MIISESSELDVKKDKPPKLPGGTAENSNFTIEKERASM